MMKTFVMTFLTAMIFALPASAGIPIPQFWNCTQMGWMNDTPSIVISDIKNGNKNPGKDYKIREEAFAKAVKKQWKLKDVYEPLCNDFIDEKEAKDYYKTIVKKANKYGITVYPIEFRWKGKVDVSKKR